MLTEETMFIFCLIDDSLKAMKHAEDPRRRLSDSEVITSGGLPVDYVIVPGGQADVRALPQLRWALPPKPDLCRAAYTDYRIEDGLAEAEQLRLDPQRKSNSRRGDPRGWDFSKGRCAKNRNGS